MDNIQLSVLRDDLKAISLEVERVRVALPALKEAISGAAPRDWIQIVLLALILWRIW